MTDDIALKEQLEYYRARAQEYDQWWYRQGRYDRGSEANKWWFSESAQVASALERFQPSGRVLELACGTGIWSERLRSFASSLVVVDGSREMLGLAKHRLGTSGVRYVEANIFEWEPNEAFDTVFFSFWLSHVPPQRFSEFWNLVGRCLTPGGRVFFLDSRHDPTSTAVDHRLPGSEAVTLRRRLNDGSEFQIYKIFYDGPQLEAKLKALGWSINVSQTERYFIYGQGSRHEA